MIVVAFIAASRFRRGATSDSLNADRTRPQEDNGDTGRFGAHEIDSCERGKEGKKLIGGPDF